MTEMPSLTRRTFPAAAFAALALLTSVALTG
jgi:hypothetical protein